MIRVMHVTDSISRRGGGMFTSVKGLCSALNVSGRICAEACAGEDEHSGADAALWNGVPLRIVPGRTGFVGKSIGVYRELNGIAADLFHLHGIWGSASVALVARKITNSGTRYVISPHGMLEPWALQRSRLRKCVAWRSWQKRELRQALCIHALCEAEAISIRELNLGRPICIIPNGVALPEALPDWTSRSNTLLFLGRLHPKKGLAELLQAFSGIEQKGGWRLVIAGWDDGGYLDDIRKLAGELRLDREVEFAGPAFGARKDELFRHSSAFILPSYSEGLPMSVLEAWSYGLPALISAECHLDVGIEAGAAIRVDPNVPSIKRGLRDLFTASRADLEAMGRRGRKLASERFSWGKIAEQFADAYEWTLGGARPDFVA